MTEKRKPMPADPVGPAGANGDSAAASEAEVTDVTDEAQATEEPASTLRATLDNELRAIKDDVLRLGALVDFALERAGQAVTARDTELADRVRWDDAEVNDLQRRVSNAISVVLATQQPMARDLRELLALYHAAA